MLPIAEDLNVDLCMENVWNGFFYSPIELRDFVDSFDSDKLGIYLDIGNLIGYQQYPPHWVELLNSRIKRVQIKDCLLYTSPSPRDRSLSRMPSSA